uniref:Gastrin-releasing peptide n=1 Tax=Callithrix jacchus TaxID=9483 RepID=A0A8I3W2F9_CALJA
MTMQEMNILMVCQPFQASPWSSAALGNDRDSRWYEPRFLNINVEQSCLPTWNTCPEQKRETDFSFEGVIALQGHLMGKKSTGESSISERGSLKQQLRKYIRWEEAARNLLGLIEAKENRSHQPPQPEALGHHQPSWDSEDSSIFKDVGSKRKGKRNIHARWGERYLRRCERGQV